MRIGIDFDNTIADYDHVFSYVANKLGIINSQLANDKISIRNHIMGQDGGAENWKRLQGQVYGRFMLRAHMMEGLAHFLTACRNSAVQVFIISHKTVYGHYDKSQIPLRNTALRWMEKHDFFNPKVFNIKRSNIFFADSRSEKVSQVYKTKCTHFIDDLIEVFNEPGFPKNTKKYLLSPRIETTNFDGKIFSRWSKIYDDIFHPDD
tara:strand:+ start:811 stop:1428 length:618 start_codon:yes stop_codon:yes gene_type:complete